MINNLARIGNFTSSEIVKLIKKGRGADLTYIKEKRMERRLGRSLTTEVDAKPMTWGKFLEPRVNDLLPTDYTYCSDQTKVHPVISYWAGSKDSMKHDEGKTVADFKCPLTLKSFCQLVDPIYNGLQGLDAMKVIMEEHLDGEKFYWQLVSNSCIDETRFAELIVYMPYKSELDEIKLQATQSGESKLYWIATALEDELPYLKDGGFYKNINIIRFEVPQADKDLLKETVINAGKLLFEETTLKAIPGGAVPPEVPVIDPMNVPLRKKAK